MTETTKWRKLDHLYPIFKELSIKSTENSSSSTSSLEKLLIDHSARRNNKPSESEILMKERHVDRSKYPSTHKNTMKKYLKGLGHRDEWKTISNFSNATIEKCQQKFNLQELPVVRTLNKFENDEAILKQLSRMGCTPENGTDNVYERFQKRGRKYSESTKQNHHSNKSKKLEVSKVSRKIVETYKYSKNHDRKLMKFKQFLKEYSTPKWDRPKTHVTSMRKDKSTDKEDESDGENVSPETSDDHDNTQSTITRSFASFHRARNKNFKNAAEERSKKFKNFENNRKLMKVFKKSAYSLKSPSTRSSSVYRKTTLFEYFKTTRRNSKNGSLERNVCSEGVDSVLNESGFSEEANTQAESDIMDFPEEKYTKGCARSRVWCISNKRISEKDEDRNKYAKNSGGQVANKKKLDSSPLHKKSHFHIEKFETKYEESRLERSFRSKRKAREKSSSSSSSEIKRKSRSIFDTWLKSSESPKNEPNHILQYERDKYIKTSLLRRKSSSEISFKTSKRDLLKARSSLRLDTEKSSFDSSHNSVKSYFSVKKSLHNDSFFHSIHKDDLNNVSELTKTLEVDRHTSSRCQVNSSSKKIIDLIEEKKNVPQNDSRHVDNEKRSLLYSSVKGITRSTFDTWIKCETLKNNYITEESKHILNDNEDKYNEKTRLLRRKSSSEISFKSKRPSFKMSRRHLSRKPNLSRYKSSDYKIGSSQNKASNHFSNEKIIHDDKGFGYSTKHSNKNDFNKVSDREEKPKWDTDNVVCNNINSGSKNRRDMFGGKQHFPENYPLFSSTKGRKNETECDSKRRTQKNLYSSEGFCESMSLEPPISGSSARKNPHSSAVITKSRKPSQDLELRDLTAGEERELSPNFYVTKICGSEAATLVNEILNSQREECIENSIEDRGDLDNDNKLSQIELKNLKMEKIVMKNQTFTSKESLSDPLSIGSTLCPSRDKEKKILSKTNPVTTSIANASTCSQINIKRGKLDSQALESLCKLHESNSWTNEALSSQKLDYNNDNKYFSDKRRDHNSSFSLQQEPTGNKILPKLRMTNTTLKTKVSTSESSQRPNKVIDKNISSEIFATQSNPIVFPDDYQEENQKSVFEKKNYCSQISEKLKPVSSDTELQRISREDPFLYKILTQDFEETENKEDLSKNLKLSSDKVNTDNSQAELLKKHKEQLIDIPFDGISLTRNFEHNSNENRLKSGESSSRKQKTELSKLGIYHGGTFEKNLDTTQVTCVDPFVQKRLHTFGISEDTMKDHHASQLESTVKKFKTEHLQFNDTKRNGEHEVRGGNMNHSQFPGGLQLCNLLKQNFPHVSNEKHLKTSGSSTRNHNTKQSEANVYQANQNRGTIGQDFYQSQVLSHNNSLQNPLPETVRNNLNENFRNSSQNASLKNPRIKQTKVQEQTNFRELEETLNRGHTPNDYFSPQNISTQKSVSTENRLKSDESVLRNQKLELDMNPTYVNCRRREEIDNTRLNVEYHLQNVGNHEKQLEDVESCVKKQKDKESKTNQLFRNCAGREGIDYSQLTYADPHLQQLLTQNFGGTPSKTSENHFTNSYLVYNERNRKINDSHPLSNDKKSETKFDNIGTLTHHSLTQKLKNNSYEGYPTKSQNGVFSPREQTTEHSRATLYQPINNLRDCEKNQIYTQSRYAASFPQELLTKNKENNGEQLKDSESFLKKQKHEGLKNDQAFINRKESEMIDYSQLTSADPYIQQLLTHSHVGTSFDRYENQFNNPVSVLNEGNINNEYSLPKTLLNSEKSETKFDNVEQSTHKCLTQSRKNNLYEGFESNSKNAVYQRTDNWDNCEKNQNLTQSRCAATFPQELLRQNIRNYGKKLEDVESYSRKQENERLKSNQPSGNGAEREVIHHSQLTSLDPHLQQLLTQNIVNILTKSYVNQLKQSESGPTESSQANIFHATQNDEKLQKNANHSKLNSEEPFGTEEEHFLSSQVTITSSNKKTKKTYNITEDCILYEDNLLKSLLEERRGRWIRQSKKNSFRRRTGEEAIDTMKTYIKKYKRGDLKIFKIKRRVIKNKEEDYRPPEDQVLENLFKKLDRLEDESSSGSEDNKDCKSVSTPVSYITDETRSEVLSTGSSKLTEAQKLLRRGINKLSKDVSLLFSKFEDTIPKDFDKFEIVSKIDRLINDVLDQYEQGRNPVFWIPKENISNCFFADGRYQMKNSPDYTAVSFGVSSSKQKFNIILFLLNKIKNLLETDTKLTKREIYYQLKIMISAQWISDHALKDICRMLNVGLWALNILAQKGLVYGNLKLVMDTGEVLNCNVPGTLIPPDISKICEIQSTAYFVLVVEKESIYHKLLEENLPNRLTRPFIMITGKGFPDLNTQLFLRKLWMIMSIPVFILVDADPDGIAIMLNYRFGSIANAHVSEHLAIPKARWLGVLPTEISKLKLPHQNLSKREISLTQKLLQLQCVKENEKIREQLETLLENGHKTGIEGLVKTETYLSNCYLNWKFHTNDLI